MNMVGCGPWVGIGGVGVPPMNMVPANGEGAGGAMPAGAAGMLVNGLLPMYVLCMLTK
jgi:hypothetical protein